MYTSALHPEDIAPVDQLHAGFPPATARLLDIGCGTGGDSRMATARGARGVGIDLTGLADRASFLTADETGLPTGPFDSAMEIHVGMNIPDERAGSSEVRRLPAPGGRFAAFDQIPAGSGDLPFPIPWAVDEGSSFVSTLAGP